MVARRVLPSSFKAGRAIRLEGTVYARGQTIPDAVVARVRRLSAYLSSRLIVPVPDTYRRRTREHIPTPTDLNAKERTTLLSR
jgi:hypothetical protein